MAYSSNPFRERMSEQTASDSDFVQLFSPKILEYLTDEIFGQGPHVFRSPPGGGKTTLLRVFTPAALHSFWNARKSDSLVESYQRLIKWNLIDDKVGPKMLGVLLSCASGYADLPSGIEYSDDGLFRALLNCRIVLRALRSVITLLSLNSPDLVSSVTLEYDEICQDLKHIPLENNIKALMDWAIKAERTVYVHLDTIGSPSNNDLPIHMQLEGLHWLQGVKFIKDGKELQVNRLLMIDDLHKLREKQRELLFTETTELRLSIPIWLAERHIALGEELLSSGARLGRDIHSIALNEIWKSVNQFSSFAQNILDRRMSQQLTLQTSSFTQCLSSDLLQDDINKQIDKGIEEFKRLTYDYHNDPQYVSLFEKASSLIAEASVDSLRELYKIIIHLSRHINKRQLTLDIIPLTVEELSERDSSKEDGAADIFMHHYANIPYYFGINKLCSLATNNIEELLSLASVLYERLKAKKVVRQGFILSATEQEKYLVEAAKNKYDVIPKYHTEGYFAQRLIRGIATFCKEKTFKLNAPYAPGVTGVRLKEKDLKDLKDKKRYGKSGEILNRVLYESVAENLLVTKDSAETASREQGLVFYLNRTLCVLNSLPLGYGGWQDVDIADMIGWMNSELSTSYNKSLSIGFE